MLHVSLLKIVINKYSKITKIILFSDLVIVFSLIVVNYVNLACLLIVVNSLT